MHHTQEFSIILDEFSQQSCHYGDSGAWIMSDDESGGSRAVGMLWGEADGLLQFTPMEDIFARIKEELNAVEV